MKNNILVFDVESTSLHGKGFAVAAIVGNSNTGEIVDKFELLSLEGLDIVSEWVKINVVPYLQHMPTCCTLLELRNKFYEFYVKWKDDADVYSDVNWPVEANFLSAIVADNMQEREFNMPYPLKDISTLIDVSIDRVKYSGLNNLVPHNPLDDCIASFTCLFKNGS